MQQYLLRRVGLALLALFALSILTFALVRSEHYEVRIIYGPGWPYDEEPSLVVQYARYMNDLSQGNWDKAWGLNQVSWSYDWGWDYKWRGSHDSGNIVLERLPTTVQLASLALALGSVLGISLGVLAAIKKGSLFDSGVNIAASVGQSMPVFWLGIILMWVFVLLLHWLPAPGGSGFTHMILPAITLALLPATAIAKLTRSAMVSALESDYVKLARIKGLSEWKIIWKHCLKNVAVSPLLSFGLIAGSFMTALVLTEAIFDWPGAGHLVLQTIHGNGYYPLLSGVVLVLAGGFILCHLIYDVFRAYLDPRIRYSEGTHLKYEM